MPANLGARTSSQEGSLEAACEGSLRAVLLRIRWEATLHPKPEAQNPEPYNPHPKPKTRKPQPTLMKPAELESSLWARSGESGGHRRCWIGTGMSRPHGP